MKLFCHIPVLRASSVTLDPDFFGEDCCFCESTLPKFPSGELPPAEATGFGYT